VKCFCRVSLWKESIWLQVRRSGYYSSSSPSSSSSSSSSSSPL
jgi:hypothetical protein